MRDISFTPQTDKLPCLGSFYPSVLHFPKHIIDGWKFVGTYVKEHYGYELIGIAWQNKSTGEVISHADFLERLFLN